MVTTIYEKYGGFGSLNKVVMAFYDSLLDSDEIGPYFDEIDMPRLIEHQTKFIAMLLGGPVSYSDSQLGTAHLSLGITNEHFDQMKTILHETLTAHEFEEADAKIVMDAIEQRRQHIVTA